MSAHFRLSYIVSSLAILAIFVLTIAGTAVEAQTAFPDGDVVAPDTGREVSVAPEARDTQIADRLTDILDASGWFDPLSVSVRQGIVVLACPH